MNKLAKMMKILSLGKEIGWSMNVKKDGNHVSGILMGDEEMVADIMRKIEETAFIRVRGEHL